MRRGVQTAGGRADTGNSAGGRGARKAGATISLGEVGAKGGESKYERPEAGKEFFAVSIILWPFRKINAAWGWLARMRKLYQYQGEMLDEDERLLTEDLQDFIDECERANREMEMELRAGESEEAI